MILWAFITAVIIVYYKALVGFGWARVGIVVVFSLLGMGGSLLRGVVRNPGQHLRQRPDRLRLLARQAA